MELSGRPAGARVLALRANRAGCKRDLWWRWLGDPGQPGPREYSLDRDAGCDSGDECSAAMAGRAPEFDADIECFGAYTRRLNQYFVEQDIGSGQEAKMRWPCYFVRSAQKRSVCWKI